MKYNIGSVRLDLRPPAVRHWWWLPIGLVIASHLWSGQALATDNQFDPGNIVSDQVLTDTSTMTVDQIQSFLEDRVRGGDCDRHRESERATNRGYSPPWTCLFEFQQNPDTGATNYGQFDSDGGPTNIPGGLSAAEIIHQASQEHRINPQVLLVLLQKQQGLVTDNWPWPIQFSLATGYSCPASDGCGTDASGFYRQISGIAQEFRQKLDGQIAITHQVGSNQIAYNSNISCGVVSVQIRNRATAVLYSLEPYTPNQAALDNLTGPGDDCSSYGNRNFWVQFLTWFGPPNAGGEEDNDPDPVQTAAGVTIFRGYTFDPGNIISNQVMTDTSTMTVDQIQSFLEDRVRGGDCDRHRESERATNRGYSPPWTCLFEFQQNPDTGATNYGQFDSDGGPTNIPGGLSAAEIIHQAGQDHGINPQVLLVLLQKEQELITDNWPWPTRYAKAIGWACPDTAACNPDSAGFYTQVTSAAKGLRGYIDNLESWWYRVGTNQIAYHPNKDCGYQTIDIKNRATAGLYLYTPYAPNEAALSNLHSVGDSCSAYGNRNFWVSFILWFGNPTRTTSGSSTTAPPRQQTPQAPTSFTPGNIISDRVIANSSSMSVNQIQTFLEQQIGSDGCNRQQASSVATRRGYSPPWTCLFEFQQNPDTGATNYGQFDSDGSPASIPGGLSAAEIIHRASQEHRINPQVLLVMIEINHKLLSDDWPWPIQLSLAANWSCQNDNCPQGPAGFSQQINGLAHRIRQQLDNPAQANYRVGQRTIAYHPDPTCGIGMVNIRNQATAAIYDQYPYLPNQSVVTSYPEAGNDCGSYQTRDFWKLFKGWFNTTH